MTSSDKLADYDGLIEAQLLSTAFRVHHCEA
jgi:hypothetical protein